MHNEQQPYERTSSRVSHEAAPQADPETGVATQTAEETNPGTNVRIPAVANPTADSTITAKFKKYKDDEGFYTDVLSFCGVAGFLTLLNDDTIKYILETKGQPKKAAPFWAEQAGRMFAFFITNFVAVIFFDFVLPKKAEEILINYFRADTANN